MDPNTYSTAIPTSAMSAQYTYYSDQQLQMHLYQRQSQQQQLELQQEQLQQLQQRQQRQLEQQIQEQQVQELQQQYVQKAASPQVPSQTISQNIATHMDFQNIALYSLREILQEYADKPDVLRFVLKAKVAEDKRIGEEERQTAERLYLESKIIELEIIKEHRKMAASFASPMTGLYTARNEIDTTGNPSGYSTSTSPMSSLKASTIEYMSAGVTPQTGLLSEQINPQQQVVSSNLSQNPNTAISISVSTPGNISLTTMSRSNSQPRTPRQFPSPSRKRSASQTDSYSDDGTMSIHQANENEGNPVVGRRERSHSHAEVMEALRNKIRTKSKLAS
ncbi:hypothetical protein K7432_006711 [Basidiobolus ranarum]|uniref:Uncharacterized protein n=1 Tax=Basidiobolus ranarum TaxID=34480 RepID=A0ABR2W174_9FUNG